MESASSEKRRPLHSYMSRKRFHEMIEELQRHGYSDVDGIMNVVCSVMNFDPNDNRYLAYQAAQLEKRAVERGVSKYEASGRKAYYHRKRTDAGKKDNKEICAL